MERNKVEGSEEALDKASGSDFESAQLVSSLYALRYSEPICDAWKPSVTGSREAISAGRRGGFAMSLSRTARAKMQPCSVSNS